MFDSRLGQFLSDDPIGFEGGDVNVRRYVGNDPVNRVDPMGLQPGVALEIAEGGKGGNEIPKGTKRNKYHGLGVSDELPTPSERDIRGQYYKNTSGGKRLRVGTVRIGERFGDVYFRAPVTRSYIGDNRKEYIGSNFMQIELRLRKPDKNCITSCHWLQFIMSFKKGPNKRASGRYRITAPGYPKYGEWNLDVRPKPYAKQQGRPFSLFYDLSASSNTTEDELSVFDRPTSGLPLEHERDTYEEGGSDAETYLVCDGRIRFVVKWSIRWTVTPTKSIRLAYRLRDAAETDKLSGFLNTQKFTLPAVKSRSGKYVEQTIENPWFNP